MTDLPAPLVATDVDLRDFQFMPLDVLRLRDSDLASRVTGEEFRAAVLLWCAAWHQKPAASLPDDDVVLSSLAGFGRVLREWQAVREGALRGWVKCSDGRLYHSVVSEKANEAWLQKQTFAWRRECDRIRKENVVRAKSALPALGFPAKPGNLPKEGDNFPLGSDEAGTGIPAENGLNGTDRTGTDRILNNPPLPITAANGSGGDWEGEGFFKTVWEGFPKDLAESEPLARQAFCELNARDQSEFAGAIRSIASHIAKQKLTRPYNLAAFIRDRRFAGFRAAPTAKAKRVKIAKDSPQGRAYEDFYRQQKGKGVPWQDDAWWFDSEWPPGHGPPIAQGLAS